MCMPFWCFSYTPRATNRGAYELAARASSFLDFNFQGSPSSEELSELVAKAVDEELAIFLVIL